MRRRESGHTLLELVIALSVGGMLLTLAMSATREVESASRKLQARASDIAERELVLTSLLRDLGAAARVGPRERTSLHIVREPLRARALGIHPADADPGVLYSWIDGLLLREDLALDQGFVLGRRVTDFRVDDLAGMETEIEFAFGTGAEQRVLTLVWEQRS